MRTHSDTERAAPVTRRARGALRAVPRRAAAAVAIAASGAIAGACATSVNSHGSSSTIGRRQVVAKEAPETLVAARGERCTVDREKFERVRTGDRVWCMWSGGSTMEDTARTRGRGRTGLP